MNEFETFIESMKNLIDVDDEVFNDEALNAILENLDIQFSTEAVNQAVNQIIQNLESQELNKKEAERSVSTLQELITDRIYGENNFVGNKKILVDAVVGKANEIFQKALEKYHSYAIELPMTVDTANGAKVPTYAHETDAAADLYAMEDQIIGRNSYGNKIRTGVKIQLPEGWLAFILPRSSMGTKTPLRLSNSVGLIDSGYRGELGVIYDNTSDNDYSIAAGDRIAQLLIMPSYRFQAKVVDILADSDRGETGFGDSGK